MSQIVLENVSDPFDVYANLEEADYYLAGNIASSNWFSATENTRKQALITATRIFNRECWLGDPSAGESGQPLAWPRDNTGIDGVEDGTTPEDITFGAIELAMALVDGSTVQTNAAPGQQGIETLKAGSVQITYFRSAQSPLNEFGRYPLPVQELVGKYLCGSQSAVFGLASGTTGDDSVTSDDFGFDDGL
jgi:hypothetical protein